MATLVLDALHEGWWFRQLARELRPLRYDTHS
jgi:hypothetical protein